MTRLAIVLLALASPAGAASADMDVLHYDVRLEVPRGEAITQGAETIRLRVGPGGVDEVLFDADVRARMQALANKNDPLD